MCRNIKPLFNFEPPATDAEIRAAALQYVRKISAVNKPSHGNEAVFLEAVEAIARISASLINHLETSAPPKNREIEAEKARVRNARRFGNENQA